MKKKLFSLFLAMAMALSLAAPASAAKINVSGMPGHEMLSLLPATFQRPAYPATVRQTDPLMTRFTDFDHKEETWPYEQSLESVFQEMVSLTDSLTAGKTTDTQKVKAIFEWVSQNVEYGILIDGIDEEGYLSKVDAYADPLQVYIRRHARCEGYALMCQFMCTIAGIPTAYIAGKAQGSGILHAWNAALADGGWIFFDATWREWDMAPNYHSSTDQLAYYDGVFLIQVFPKGVSDGYDVRLRLRTGFSCPNSVTVPDGVTWVDLKNYPGLTDITLPDSVTEVYFTGCTGLTNVTLPNSMTSIEGGAFNGCTSLKSVKLPASLTTIGNSAFMGCTSLKSVAIPDSVTTLENLAFAQSGLTSVTVPGSVTRMEAVFYECADLESVTLSRGITSIQDSMFMGCTSLKNVTIPDTVKTIEDQAFWNCTSLERVIIPDGVTSIGKLAFADCKSLKQADLPDSVTSIDGSAFTGCTSLKQSAAIPGGMTTIADGTFQDRTDLTSFVIPDHVTQIGNWAFRNCTNLKSVTIPTSVTSIGGAIFGGSMTDVYYAGTEAQWKAISIEEPNYLDRVTVHYNSAGPDAPSPAPDDTPSDWAREQVEAAIQAALVPGDLQGAYRSNITREEFCRLMVVLVEKKTGTTASAYAQSRGKSITDPFTDTDSADVLAAYALGIVNGTSATTFNPVGSITRQEAASMLARTAGILDITAGKGQSFRDESDIASWAREGVGFVSGLTDPVTGNAVMGGTGNGGFSPLAPYTREQAYLTVLRLSHCGG